MSALTSANMGVATKTTSIGVAGDSKDSSSTFYDDTKSLNEYVLVKRKALDDVKSKGSAQASQTQESLCSGILQKPALLRNGTSKMMSRVKLNPLTTKLVITGGGTAAAGAAFSTVTAVDPTQSSEFSSFASLYDQCKVEGGEVLFHIAQSAGAGGIFVEAIVAYDPSNAGVYTSVDGALVASQNSGLKLASGYATASNGLVTIGSPIPMNSSGWWSFKFKCPKQPTHVATATAADQELSTGNWIDCNTVLTPKFGYIKLYVSAPGSNSQMNLDMHIVLDVRFRSRS